VAGVALEFATRLMARFELSDSLIDNLAFLFIPYAAYLLAESVHVSGVLATVAAGVYMGRRSAIIYGPDTRLVGRSVWMLINYLLNGFVFLLIGLQLRQIVESPTFSPREITIGLIVSLVAILTRIAWVFPATWLPRFLSRRTRAREPLPVNRNVAIVAWTGLRGIVSLAAALALPYSDATGGPFGQRDLIVFVTFCVIVVTLVFQGLSLIPLLSLLKIKGDESIEEREVEVRVHALRAGLDRLTKLESREHTPEEWEAISRIKAEYEHRIDHLEGHIAGHRESTESEFDHKLQDEALSAERHAIMRMRDEGRIPDDIFRRIEYDLDLAATRLS
jgi:CPA1 family monovalent cation:H+ antiporter